MRYLPRIEVAATAGIASLILATLLATALSPMYAMACGKTTDCRVGERSYRVHLSPGFGQTGNRGAIIFVHGYRGTANGVMENKALTKLADELGIALIAVQAANGEWNLPGVPHQDALEGVDEAAYFDDVLNDARARFGLSPEKVMVSGFSSGGMMVWHLACYRGNAFAGFVPMSGTFWEPIPSSCPAGAVNLIHYHGTEDPTVPLAGRQIKDAHQGDVFKAVAMMARLGGYNPVAGEKVGDMTCERQENAAGKRLELCLFPAKHMFRVDNLKRAWLAFENTK